MAVLFVFLLAFSAGCVAVLLRRQRAQQPGPHTVAGRIRGLGGGIALLPMALLLYLASGGAPLAVLIVLASGMLAVLAPAAARRVLPFALIAFGLWGVVVVGSDSWLSQYQAGWYGGGPWLLHLVLPGAIALLVTGGYLMARGTGWPGALAALIAGPARARRGVRAGGALGARHQPWNLLLIPVIGLWAVLSVPIWGSPFGIGGDKRRDLAVLLVLVLLTLIVVRALPAIAADLAVAGLLAFGIYGVALALRWPSMVPYERAALYGVVYVTDRPLALLAGLQGLALTGVALWLVPRALDAKTLSVLWPRLGTEAELAVRVEQLKQTRTEAVDSAAAELRRVERDLHDGAQARLVAVGMNLRAAQKILTTSPEAASQLLAEAIETSSRALTELRNLVRGIHPPVLADRGLPDAIRALALDTPLHVVTDIELDGRPEPPVESACYFAVAEALANAVKHAGARHVQIHARHDGSMLRIEVTDDGAGGADPGRGTGLHGLERRLATFDGILAVSSPPGGPTLIVIEVPCALSSPKISSS